MVESHHKDVPPPLDPADIRRGLAFMAAPTIATLIYAAIFTLVTTSRSHIHDLTEAAALFLIVLAVGAIPVSLATICLLLPYYNLLRRASRVTTTNLLAGFFIIGAMTGAPFSPSSGGYFLGPGLCALIGGLVFCWLTIWRKPEAGGASNGP